ncbi:MAG TPA: NUDIX domain-containing protein [Paracoccaceae bacterium]|nr:NUDIX domain-containing protein [Paracoccaceae bacterium]
MTPDPRFRTIGDWSRPGRATGASVLVEDQHGRLLMQLRDDRPSIIAPGLWCFFGGAVEPGEDVEAAAMREFEEETGLRFGRGELQPFVRVVTEERNWTRLFIFRARRPIDPSEVRLGEGAGMALLTPAQALTYPLVPPLSSVIEAHCADPLPVSAGPR